MSASLFRSKSISRNEKLKLYESLIRSFLTYAREILILREAMKQNTYEKMMFRSIFGPSRKRIIRKIKIFTLKFMVP